MNLELFILDEYRSSEFRYHSCFQIPFSCSIVCPFAVKRSSFHDPIRFVCRQSASVFVEKLRRDHGDEWVDVLKDGKVVKSPIDLL